MVVAAVDANIAALDLVVVVAPGVSTIAFIVVAFVVYIAALIILFCY